MSGAVPVLPHMPSWCGQGQLSFTFVLPCPKTMGQAGAPSSNILNVTVGRLAAALPVNYSHSPTVEPADSSRRIREPPNDAWEQWRSLILRRLGPIMPAVNPSDYEFYKMTTVY